MSKYGIDIVDEWLNVPDGLKGIRYFDNLDEAIKWGENYTHMDDPIAHAFFIFETDGEKVIYCSISEKNRPIKNRFEILDIR